MGVICVLPARISSTRISRKPLQQIAGRTLIEWCWRAACAIRVFDRVVVATDSEEIEADARRFEADVVRTRSEHVSGTDRVDEAADLLGVSDEDVVVNYQADEPFVDSRAIERAVRSIREIATVAAPIRDEAEWRSAAIVKVVRAGDGRALYFSRSPIPHSRDELPVFAGGTGVVGNGTTSRDRADLIAETNCAWLRHIGVYACRRGSLRRWAELPESPLERIEKLEQLRALEAGLEIHVEVGPWTQPGVDIPEDIERAERLLSKGS